MDKDSDITARLVMRSRDEMQQYAVQRFPWLSNICGGEKYLVRLAWEIIFKPYNADERYE